MIASGGVVLDECRKSQLIGFHNFVFGADFAGHAFRDLQFSRRESGRERRHGEGVLSQFIRRNFQDQRAIDAAGVGDEYRFHARDDTTEPVELLPERFGNHGGWRYYDGLLVFHFRFGEIPDHDERVSLGIQILLGHALDVLFRHAFNPFGIVREVFEPQSIEFHLSENLRQLRG